MKKNYLLDTTVLLYDPAALFAFEDNNVIIPMSVIEEIDHFKRDMSEVGRNARQTSRILDGLRSRGSLTNGVRLDNSGVLSIRIGTSDNFNKISRDFVEKKREVSLFAVVFDIKGAYPDIPAIFVTKDVNLRIKADALGITVEDYESDKVEIEDLYPGYTEYITDGATIESLKEQRQVKVQKEFFANQYITLIDEKNGGNIAYGRYSAQHHKIVPLIPLPQNLVHRISSRNREQTFVLDALLNDEISFVTLVGKAGTGKTLLAIAASIYKTVDENIYNRILVSRPTLPMGQDIGYLPGTIEDKLTPWMYPIADNVELIMRSNSRQKVRGFKELVDMGILIIEPLTFIRGRSIHNQFMIVDEAQNLTPHEIKTVITRVGDGTKIVLTGDPYQIDNPYIDSSSNGLTYSVEKFKGQQVAAHITLTKGERSVLSELAANLL
jgi:PhoH-like ATPase